MSDQAQIEARQAWMSLLAKCAADALDEHWQGLAISPDHRILRAPETGSVMVRGRTGATGMPFNLGEVTVTRCSVRLETGEEGHAYVQGRSREKAQQAALVDALLQTTHAELVRTKVLDPLREQAEAIGATRSAKAAATKVDFFTMARGGD
ncbi:MAG: phosphonate C-P lyase system protein PhnG [Pseudomonadota bacterium]